MTRRRARSGRSMGLAGIFAVPALLFVVSFAGLVLALLYTGAPDIFSAIAAGCGLIALVWALTRKR